MGIGKVMIGLRLRNSRREGGRQNDDGRDHQEGCEASLARDHASRG